MRRGLSALVLVLAGAATIPLLAQLAAPAARQNTVDESPHRVGMVAVNGIRVPYLDWGGTGPALLFFPGMGNSAHVFDDFAPRFVDRFRVVGVTRVGFGESDHPEQDGYDLASRVAHIKETLDTLSISRVVLVGHSLGGDEITAFAGTYPERTAGLIYLDAAIDHTAAFRWQELFRQFAAGAPTPGATDLASATAFRQFLFRTQNALSPIGEVLAMTTRDTTGVITGQRAPPRVFSRIQAETVSPAFAKVKAPALALYSDSGADEMFPWLKGDAVRTAQAQSMLDETFHPQMTAERARFAREVPGAQTFAYHAHHYQFLTIPDDTERRMRAFLAGIPAY
jgi:non-heme chloroperoxidase